METINLNLIPSGTRPVVHASQYDTGRQFKANLYEGAAVYTLTGAETVIISVRKNDGHIVTEGITNTSDSYVIIETTEQMTACAGENMATIKLTDGDVEIGSLNFILAVEEDTEAGGDPSESFIHNLDTQIAAAVAEQYDSNNVIFDNAPTAGHGVGFAVTSEGIKTTIDSLEVGDLADVTITTPQVGEALVFDNDGNLVNGTVSTVGSIDDLNDVDTTGKADGDSLVYNSNDSEWQAKKLTVTLTQAEYDALKLSGDLVEGTEYIITDGQNVSCDLGDLNDTNIDSSTSVGQVIAFNGTKWINSNSVITLTNKVNQFTDWTTSTTSFTDACSKLGIYSGIGAVLDSLKTNISSYTASTINNKVDTSQGPNFFMIFGKANDLYFTGILLSYFYNDSSRQPIMFTYSNGTYVVKRI